MPLATRAQNACELCTASDNLAVYDVGPDPDGTVATQALLCQTCREQISGEPDPTHWRALSASMWSEHAPVQVLAWRMLDRLSDNDWARDLADMLYLDDETENASIVTIPDMPNDLTGPNALEMFTDTLVLDYRTGSSINNNTLDVIDAVDPQNEDGITLSGGTATFSTDFELLVPTNRVYAPGGGVAVDDIRIEGTLIGGASSSIAVS